MWVLSSYAGTVADPEDQRRTWNTDVSAPVHNLVQGERFDNATINITTVHEAAPARPALGVPVMLPAAYGPYTDRFAVHERLDRMVAENDVGMVLLGGVAGVGKSTTAVHYLKHCLEDDAERFRGGVYYADLGGRKAGLGASVADALESWLIAKGMPASEVPASLTARSDLFRQLTAGKPVAVLIDDPVSAAQVKSLRPTSPGSLVLVTSHRESEDIQIEHAAQFVPVPMLDPGFALELLTKLVGADRLSAEPEAFGLLAAFSGGLPLMLHVIAAEVKRWESAGELAARLVDIRTRRQTSSRLMNMGGDHSVNAALELSVSGLPEPARVLLWSLAANPGGEFGPDLVTFLDGDSGALADLVAAGLVSVLHEPGVPRPRRRWRMHALVQDFVWSTAQDDLGTFTALQQRILGFYLRRTAMADRALSKRWHSSPDFPDQPPFTDPVAALAWLGAEQVNLRNAVFTAYDLDEHDVVWQLCEVLWGLYFATNPFGDWIDTHEKGIDSAQRMGNKEAEARLRLQRAFAYYNQEDIEQALEEFQQALPVAEDSGSARVIAATVESIGLADLKLGRPKDALEKFDRVLTLVAGDSEAIGNAERHRARTLGALGRRGEAIDVLTSRAIPAYERAAEEKADGSNAHNVARALVALGELLVADGRAGQALVPLDRAVAEFDRLGKPLHGAEALVASASAHAALGDVDQASAALDRAAEAYEAVGSRKAAEIRARRSALGGGVTES